MTKKQIEGMARMLYEQGYENDAATASELLEEGYTQKEVNDILSALEDYADYVVYGY